MCEKSVLKKRITIVNSRNLAKEVADQTALPVQYTTAEIKAQAAKVASELKEAESEKLRLEVKKKFNGFDEKKKNPLKQQKKNQTNASRPDNSGGPGSSHNHRDVGQNGRGQNNRVQNGRGQNNRGKGNRGQNGNYKDRDLIGSTGSENKGPIRGSSTGSHKNRGNRYGYIGRGKPYGRQN